MMLDISHTGSRFMITWIIPGLMIIATGRLCDEPEGIYEDAAVIFSSIIIGAYFVESSTSHTIAIH